MSTDLSPAVPENRPGWRYYLQEKVLILFFLGFSAGLPFPLVYATLTAWLEEAGLERSTISTFAWLGFAYSFKFVWSPLVDSLKLPLLTRWLGQRRSWLLLAQLSVGLGLLAMSNTDPALATPLFVVFSILVAFSSATQDIALDAYRIEIAGSDRSRSSQKASHSSQLATPRPPRRPRRAPSVRSCGSRKRRSRI